MRKTVPQCGLSHRLVILAVKAIHRVCKLGDPSYLSHAYATLLTQGISSCTRWQMCKVLLTSCPADGCHGEFMLIPAGVMIVVC